MRKIDKIIIHCSATPEGRAVTVRDIDKWHREKGYNGIGYHYVIGLNGEVRKGRDINLIGAHTQGQNYNSIGICYVGGCDKAMKAKDTRTHAQKVALLNLVKELKKQYPKASIHGHNEFAAKACPSFNVKSWLLQNKI
ncbi:MAG: N-acetylmuramoyl-L-alanine amidase [Bacteroidales bacterium]